MMRRGRSAEQSRDTIPAGAEERSRSSMSSVTTAHGVPPGW
jgi:hypothetical protein